MRALVCLCLLIPVESLLGQAGSVKTVRGLTFAKAGDSELKLDLAMPQGDGPFPALVCIHGGGWVRGDRQQMAQSIRFLAQRGYVAISIDYRLAPTHRFPAQIEDCKAAVRWLRAEAAKHKVDTKHIGVLGFSAGAHLACLMGVTRKEDGFEGKGGHAEQSSAVQAVVSFFGPTDLTYQGWNENVVKDNLIPLLGTSFRADPALYGTASPIRYVRKGAPPFLFFHGTNDHIVPMMQSETMMKKLQAEDVSARLVKVEEEGHGWRGDTLDHTLKQMVKFFDSKLKP